MREIEREREEKEKREREREKERNWEGAWTNAPRRGMTGALAPFSYLVGV